MQFKNNTKQRYGSIQGLRSFKDTLPKNVKKIINWFNDKKSLDFEIDEDLAGGCSFDKHGTPITDEVFYKALESAAVMLGAVGGPKWEKLDFIKRPERGLLKIRKELDLFANFRPAIVFDALVSASRTTHIIDLVEQTDFAEIMKGLGYSLMYITSKTGAYIDGNKVDRDTFFETLSDWGRDDDKKFIVIHHSILSEGINVSGLESVIFMRNMDYITFSQTIGRVIRLHHNDAKNIRDGKLTAGDIRSYQKPFGLLVVPVHSQVGINTARRLQEVVDTIFVDGEPAISVMK